MKLTKLRTIASIFTVAAVAGVVALAIPANGAGTADNRYITVTGIGRTSVVPNAVRFNTTVSSIGWTNASALSLTTKSAEAVHAALKTAGIATKDVRSANISVCPEYNWSQAAGTKITGYRASQSIDVLVRTASKAGSIIEAVVTRGSDGVQLGGVIPTTPSPSAATEVARAAAFANVKSKASSYAKLLGTSIGEKLSPEEQSSPVYSWLFPTAKAAAIEIDLGEQDGTVTITVRWALN
jgi:uncharacterized protein YggE